MAVRLGPGREFDLIRGFLAGRAALPDGVLIGPGDDCAIVTGEGIALTADLSIEGVHFRRDWLEPRAIGFRATAASLSDLAAMAARPLGVLVSLAVSDADARTLAPEIMHGVATAVEALGGSLLGGDLTRSPGPIILDVVGVGNAEHPVLRSGALPGHEVWVTGELGAAAAAVAALRRGDQPDPAALERFVRPAPRIRESLWLADRSLPGSMIDLSDGLAGDVGHIAEASGVAVVLEVDAVPLHPTVLRAAATPDEALSFGLSGGEDYELCFTAPPGLVQVRLKEFESVFGIGLHRVGFIELGEGVFLRSQVGARQRIGRGGFQHFE